MFKVCMTTLIEGKKPSFLHETWMDIKMVGIPVKGIKLDWKQCNMHELATRSLSYLVKFSCHMSHVTTKTSTFKNLDMWQSYLTEKTKEEEWVNVDESDAATTHTKIKWNYFFKE